LPHRNEQEVTSPNFNSYVARQYDKSTTLEIDTDLTIHTVVDPGSIDLVPIQTPNTTTVGFGNKTFTVAR